MDFMFASLYVESVGMDVPRALDTARVWSRGNAKARKTFYKKRMVTDEDHRRMLITEVVIELSGVSTGTKDRLDLENLLLVAQNIECGREH
jgi:hypothetical protein